MSRRSVSAFAVSSVLLFVLTGCCSILDIDCSRKTTITVLAASENPFDESGFYEIHWAAGEESGTVDSENEYDFVYAPESLVFVIDTSLEGNSTVDLELHVDRVRTAGPETLELERWETTSCKNRDGPSWCENEPVSQAAAEWVLDGSVW